MFTCYDFLNYIIYHYLYLTKHQITLKCGEDLTTRQEIIKTLSQ